MKIIFQDDDGKILREEVLSEAECIAMDTDMIDRIEWIVNATRNKARQMVDHIVTQSGLGSKFTPVATKEDIVLSLKKRNSPLVLTALERENGLAKPV